MTSYIVRAARPDDAHEIARVHVGTWQAAYRGLVPDDYLDALNADARVEAYERFGVLKDAERPMWVAERDGQIAGFIGVGPNAEEPGLGEVFAIYVDSEHWGHGAGRALMQHAVDWLRARFPAATLWVLEGDAQARRFYEKVGWYFDGMTEKDDRGSFVLREVRYRIEL